ncbi:hypothetical protein [Streptomyces sp. CB02460]|uniref:hypothetical protein n=1 Tax=Streptomyces sp. CB02460 TaxID=1703941 RepID=UPI00093B4F4F|nr:hypothetical protein [Streptomyces sp. CB02460]OKJ70346.1 hypothetical protein AMK30_25950 [Streptomyces sp. CB02460]
MAEVEDLIEDVAIRLPEAGDIRARGQRRRTRARAVRGGAAGAVVLTAAGAWGLLLPSDGPEARQTVSTTTANPFRVGGEVVMRPAGELPGYATWHWKETASLPEGAGPRSDALPQVGLDGACPASFVPADEPGQQRYSVLYTGSGHALAQHRVIEYEATATARSQVTALRGAMERCGLHSASPSAREKEEGSAVWSGTVEDGRTLRVTVRRWESWVSVEEVLHGKPVG